MSNTRAACVAYAGVSSSTVAAWMAQGKIMQRTKNEWDLDEFIAEIECLKIVKPYQLGAIDKGIVANNSTSIDVDEDETLTYNQQRTRLTFFQAEHQRLSLLAVRKHLAPAEDIIRMIEALFIGVRTSFLGLEQRIVDPIRAAETTEEAKAIAKEMIRSVLQDISETDAEEWFYRYAPTPRSGYTADELADDPGRRKPTPRTTQLASPLSRRPASYEIAGTAHHHSGKPMGGPESKN